MGDQGQERPTRAGARGVSRKHCKGARGVYLAYSNVFSGMQSHATLMTAPLFRLQLHAAGLPSNFALAPECRRFATLRWGFQQSKVAGNLRIGM